MVIYLSLVFACAGCTGLEELLGIESLFEEFQETLFSQASKTLERSVQTKEVNQKLDAGINLFLSRLSPYFLLKPAQKCLEWLVYRYHYFSAIISCGKKSAEIQKCFFGCQDAVFSKLYCQN